MQQVIEYLLSPEFISTQTAIGSIASFLFGAILFGFRLKSARKKIAIQESELENLRIRTDGESTDQSIRGLEKRKEIAERHLREREEALRDIEESLTNLSRTQEQYPQLVGEKKKEIANLQRLVATMEKELGSAGNAIKSLTSQKDVKADEIRRTKSFIKYADNQIQEAARKYA